MERVNDTGMAGSGEVGIALKIVFLVSSMNAGGAERVAATLASAWAERGDQVTLVSTYIKKGACFYSLAPSVKLVWLGDYLKPSRNPVIASLKKLRALRRLISQERPDVIVSFLTNVNVMALLSTRKLGVPIIVCERTNPAVSSSSSTVLKQLRRWTYPWADMVTVQTYDSVAPFKKMVPQLRSLQVVPNPVPPQLLDMPLAACVPDSKGRRHLAAMGRLVSAKQFSFLIQAFSQVAAQQPEWDLVIWGEGPLRNALSQQIQDLGLSSRVFLPGRTETPWEQLAQVGAFALTSAVEGFPNVLLEAMAIGLPCIAFDCPSGPREITRDGQDALLIPANDVSALSAGLQRLLSDTALRQTLGERAALSVRGRYALPVVLSEWDALMRKVGAMPSLPVNEGKL